MLCSFQHSTSTDSCLFCVDLVSISPPFCVDFSFLFCRRLLGCLSILGQYSVSILCVWLHIIATTSTSPLCPFRFVHPQVVPLIVSSHLLNVPPIISWLNITICSRTYTVIHDSIIISKLDFKKCLSVSWRPCVDVSSVLCRYFVYLLPMCAWLSDHIGSVFGPYSVRIIVRNHWDEHKPALRLRSRVVPLIASSHFLNVPPPIVSWLNIMICDRTCTVSYNTIFISKLDFEKVVSVFYRCCVDVSSVLCRYFVYFVSMFAWFYVHIRSVFGPYSVVIIAHHHRNQHKPALRLRSRTLLERRTYCIMTGSNDLWPNMYSNL